MKAGIVTLSAVVEAGRMDADFLLRAPHDARNSAAESKLLASLRQRGLVQVFHGEDSDPELEDWVVYLARCADDTFYAGITRDLDKRIEEHNGWKKRGYKKGAKYTRGRRPVVAVAAWVCRGRANAAAVEHLVRKLPHGTKEKVASGEISLETDINKRIGTKEAR